jgi:methyl-coenzyme M reductase alpha subunit
MGKEEKSEEEKKLEREREKERMEWEVERGWGVEEDKWKTSFIPAAEEKKFALDPKKMMEKILPFEKMSPLYTIFGDLYDADPMDMKDHLMYKRGGLQQSRTKQEFTDWGKKIAIERGIPSYNREVGIPMGQRTMETYAMLGSDAMATYDDVNFFNNVAMQQCLDDIKRTIILNLDVAHRTIQLRLGKEISPETMNLFLETMQHRLAGGAVIQEHMSEVHPGLTKDGYAKVFTGDDDLADQFDRRFIIDINKEFHPDRAEMLKTGVGEKLSMAVHEPTIRVRMMDGGAVVRSGAQSATMAFCATYRLTGESVLADIAYSTRHAQQVRMGEIIWPSRARAPNEPGGIPFGYYADLCPGESDAPPVPTLELIASGDIDGAIKLIGAMTGMPMWVELTTNLWYGQYMAGGIGFNAAAYSFLGFGFDIQSLTSGFIGDMVPGGGEAMGGILSMVGGILGGHKRMPAKWRTVRPFVNMIVALIMDEYDKYPTFLEFHWGGAIRTFIVGYAGGIIPAFLTGDSLLTQMAANYAIALGMKEGWLRTGWSGQEVQHHLGLSYATSLRPDEGGLPELKGCNVPYMSYTVGALGFPMFCYGAMLARGSAWSASPLIKITFADRDLAFDFRNPTSEFGKAVLREYEPAGERDIIRPAK